MSLALGRVYFASLAVGEQFAYGKGGLKAFFWEKRDPFLGREVTGILDDLSTMNAVRIDRKGTCARFAPFTEVQRMNEMKLKPLQRHLLQLLRDNPTWVVYTSLSYAYLYNPDQKTTEEWFRHDTVYNLLSRRLLVYSHDDPANHLAVCKLAPEDRPTINPPKELS